MTRQGENRAAPTRAEVEALLELITSSWKTQALRAAAELDIAGHLAAGPRSSSALARSTQADPASLHRLLRALASIGVCAELDSGDFDLTPMGRLLEKDRPGSLHNWTLYWGGPAWHEWSKLSACVETGVSARKKLVDSAGFDHFERDPELADLFHRAMSELTGLVTHEIVRCYDFDNARRIVDLGGGYGELLAQILERNPRPEGVLFELPHVVTNARQRLTARGVASRCEIISGDFFDSVPENGDIYILKSVLHDWNDEECSRLLANCRRSMADTARVLIVERVMPDRLEQRVEHQSMARSDLHMLVAQAARERTESQFAAMLTAAGLKVQRITPLGLSLSLIEARRAAAPHEQ